MKALPRPSQVKNHGRESKSLKTPSRWGIKTEDRSKNAIYTRPVWKKNGNLYYQPEREPKKRSKTGLSGTRRNLLRAQSYTSGSDAEEDKKTGTEKEKKVESYVTHSENIYLKCSDGIQTQRNSTLGNECTARTPNSCQGEKVKQSFKKKSGKGQKNMVQGGRKGDRTNS